MKTVPLWWQAYANGRGFPGRDAALAERFSSDPPSTFDERFLGSLPDAGLSARERLIWRRGFWETDYLRLLGVADWDGVPDVVRGVCGKVCLLARDWGIPLYVSRAFYPEPLYEEGRTFALRHCRYQDMLADDEWVLLHQLVEHVALCAGVTLRPVPEAYGPGVFSVECGQVPRCFERVALTPVALSRSLP